MSKTILHGKTNIWAGNCPSWLEIIFSAMAYLLFKYKAKQYDINSCWQFSKVIFATSSKPKTFARIQKLLIQHKKSWPSSTMEIIL